MISIQNRQRWLPYLANSLRRRGQRLLDEMGLGEAEVSVLLCDDTEIRALNAAWRGVDSATDVLSFPLFEPQENFEHSIAAMIQAGDTSGELGDIVISAETCIRQAAEWSHEPNDEAIRLWLHGLLHLCGYDHEDDEDAKIMQAREEGLLKLFRRRPIQPLTQR